MTDKFKSEAEFLRSTATDIVTGDPLYDDARPDLYAIDARRIANRIEELEAENARLLDLVPRWSDDMDAAPKDGTRVLAYWPDVFGNNSAVQVESWFGPRQASWDDACWQNAFEWDDGSNSPTHWMPLPPPPIKGET